MVKLVKEMDKKLDALVNNAGAQKSQQRTRPVRFPQQINELQSGCVSQKRRGKPQQNYWK